MLTPLFDAATMFVDIVMTAYMSPLTLPYAATILAHGACRHAADCAMLIRRYVASCVAACYEAGVTRDAAACACDSCHTPRAMLHGAPLRFRFRHYADAASALLLRHTIRC